MGSRNFSAVSPALWNNLPSELPGEHENLTLTTGMGIEEWHTAVNVCQAKPKDDKEQFSLNSVLFCLHIVDRILPN